MISVLLLFVVCVVAQTTFRFNSTGYFKLIQFTDTHNGELGGISGLEPKTQKVIETVLDSEKPDLVVFSGDVISGEGYPRTADPKEWVLKYMNYSFWPCESRGIHFLYIFGNWDREGPFNGKQLVDLVKANWKYAIIEHSAPGVQGDAVYNQVVYPYRGSVPAFNIYLFDTHGNTDCPDYLKNGCGCFPDSEIAWYNQTSHSLTALAGKPVPSLVFQHIALQEHLEMWNTLPTYGRKDEDSSCLAVNPPLITLGNMNGDIKGISVGHDHDTDFSGYFKGIFLMYGRKTGYTSYGPPTAWGPHPRGARVFLMNLNPTFSFTTWFREEDGSYVPGDAHPHTAGQGVQPKCNHAI